MLKLSEWNGIIIYGNICCNELVKSGYNAKLTSYTMHDKRKGLYINIDDELGDIYKQYATGVYDSVDEYKNALDKIVRRVKTEC